MIDWLQSGDDALFRFVNHTLSNGVFDTLMPLASNTPWFVPVVIFVLVAADLEGRRARACLRGDAGSGDLRRRLAGRRLAPARGGRGFVLLTGFPTRMCSLAEAAVSACLPPMR